MNIFRSLLLLVVALTGMQAQAQVTKDPTTWTFEAKKIDGDKYKVIVHLAMSKDWHIWSLKPGGDGLQVAPGFKFDKNAAVKVNGTVKESGKKITGEMEGVDGIVNYFKDKVTYEQELTVSANTKVTGTYMYQVCNDQMCLPPKTKKFSVEIRDAAAAAVVADTTARKDTTTSAVMVASPNGDTVAIAGAPTTGTDAKARMPADGLVKPEGAAPEDTVTEHSNGLLFFEGLGFGLASVITPCVFAMLPMTVSFFLKRSKDRKTGVRIALQYCLSIIVIFTAIGGLIAVFFKPDTLHAFSTNWIVNLFFFLVFIAFGISFLGAFEINLPSSWATKMDSKANTRNFVGIFFMALTLVIVSFSCTGPFISSMITLMGKGGKAGPLIGFFGFGLGLALPFALFALFPSLINELGKQGGWLNVVKVTFGFVELALALKFLSNADLQKGWRLLDREIFIAIWVALSFLLGFYLLGVYRFSHDSEMPKNDWGLPYLKVPRFLFASVAIIFGFYLLPGMWGAPLNGMGAFVPPMGTQDFVLGTEGGGSIATSSGNAAGSEVQPVKFVEKMKLNEPPVVVKYRMTVFFDYQEALAASAKTGKPVMLDFTGINCANCRKMETSVWSRPEVMQRLKNDFILASLYCDANAVELPKEDQYFSKALEQQVTTLGEKCQDIELGTFGANGLPGYFFVDDKGTRLYDKGVFYPTSAEDFIKILDNVKAKYKELHP